MTPTDAFEAETEEPCKLNEDIDTALQEITGQSAVIDYETALTAVETAKTSYTNERKTYYDNLHLF